MANIFKAKTLVSRTGIFSHEVIAPNLVYNTGDQNISGNKNFLNNIGVSGTGVFSAIDLNNIDTLSLSGVNISIVDGTISLTNRPNVNGTGVVLSGELNSTGIFLNNKINSLSGYVNSQDLIFSGQIASTGSNLTNSINSLSGASVLLYGNQTISGIKTFAENAVFGDPSQGDFLVISGNTFTIYGSGNFTNGLFVSGVPVLTGLPNWYATSTDLALTGSILNNKINNLSGFINDNVVFKTGNQTILGQKTFSGTTTVIGHFAATSKSFLIDHPLDNNKKLQYASLEGPEHGVFLRGKTNENIINLPNYWSALVDENTISVNLTPINVYSNIYVVDYNNSRIITNGNNGNYYFYTVYGERKDIPKLTVEF